MINRTNQKPINAPQSPKMVGVVLFLIFFALFLPMASAIYYIGNGNYGDDFEDATINATFWQTWTDVSGDTATITEESATDGYLSLKTSANDDGSDSHAIAQVNTTNNLYGYGDLFINMTLNTSISSTGSTGNLEAGVKIRVNDGGTLRDLFTKASTTGVYNIIKENWYIEVNATSNQFKLYNESALVATQTMTTQDWKLNFYSISEEPVAGGGAGGTRFAEINLFNITIVSETPQVSLIYPSNASSVADTVFNASITKGDGTLKNATLLFWNATSSLINRSTNPISGNINNTYFDVAPPTTLGAYHWNVLACDTTNKCGFQSTNNTITYGFSVDSETYTSPAIETQEHDFELNITIPASSTISLVRFYYNNTQYTVSPTLISGNNYKLTQAITTPEVNGDTNINFHWEVIFTSGFNQNTTTKQQLVQKYQGIEIAESCTAGFDEALRFTFSDENLTARNTSAEFNIEYGFDVDSTNLTAFGNLTNIGSFVVCINATLPTVVTGDAQIKYGDGIYSERNFFVFSGVELTNVTNNHTLYNLQSSLATSFLVKVKDNALTSLTDKYVSLLRWYPELNEYKIVEMGRTDDDGQTIIHVVPEDVDYKIAIYEKNGTLLKLTEPVRMVCLVNPCEIQINVGELTNFISFSEIETTLTYNNNTGVFTFTWNDPNQLTTEMNLTVYKMTSTSTIALCSTTSTSFTGTIICDVSGNTGVLKAVVTRSASPPIIISTLIADIRTTIVSVGGGDLGLFLSFLLVVFVALASLVNPILGVIGAIIAMVPAMILGGITKTVFLFLVSMAIIVVIMMGRSNR